MNDLPTLFRTAASFWDGNGRLYLFGQGNAALNPPYDRVIYHPDPDVGQIENNLNIPADIGQVTSATNDERDDYIVGGLKEMDSIFWYQLQIGDGKYCPTWGLPGAQDVLFYGTGVAYVPKWGRVYVFGRVSRYTTIWMETTHDSIWYIDVAM